eukprot:m.30290 g.30290  ORF g.30290 m.30290 type:complete len:156 (-) comp6775_c0_seq2:218-685(-)
MADGGPKRSRKDVRIERIGPKREAVGGDLRLKVREAFETLLQNFAALLKAAGGGSAVDGDVSENAPPFESEVARNDYAMRVGGNNIIRAAEGLLTLSGRLQRLLVVNDHAALNAHQAERSAELRAHRENVWRTLAELRDDVGAHLADLEDEAAAS